MRHSRSVLLSTLLLLFVVLGCGFSKSDVKDVWTESSFEDFRDGLFDSSGQNLYVTAKGQIKTIHHFDLNQDGYNDVVFCNAHDFTHTPEATLYTQPKGRSGGKVSSIAMPGSQCGAAGDTNKDGFIDLVLCPNNDGVSPRRYARIFWGGKDGWVRHRTQILDTISPSAVQIADIDRDGWDDILILNRERWARQEGRESRLRIYWGSEESFKQEEHKDILINGKARSMVVRDLDGDKRPDIAIMQKPIVYDVNDNPVKGLNSEMLVYWNDDIKQGGAFPKPQHIDINKGDAVRGFKVIDFDHDGLLDFVIGGGNKTLYRVDPTTKNKMYYYSGLMRIPGAGKRQWGQLIETETPKISAFDMGDFNSDGYFDMVVCNAYDDSNSVGIMWGDASGLFKTEGMTKLDLPKIQRVVAVDIDGDGNLDIVAGPWRADEDYESDARILYGNGKGEFELAEVKIKASNVSDIVTAPTDSGDGMRVVFCNVYGGRIYEDVPVYVYWGAKGGFDPKRRTEYPNRSGNYGNVADLDNDGLVDLVLVSNVHAESADHPELGFSIYWGGKNGPRIDKRTILHEYGAAGINISDFNRDGWLDLMATCNKVSDQNEPRRIVIRYGGPDGFTDSGRFVLPCDDAAWSNDVADFDKDGWLDIVVSLFDTNRFGIFWGGPKGYSQERYTTYPAPGADNMKAADLNADGWLDLIITCYNVPGTLDFDYGTRIFWGGKEGFSVFRSQQLRGYAAFGVSVADYDKDGYLDLHVCNYKMRQIRDAIPSFLYWGSANGYSNDNFTPLLQDSGTGTQSCDFDGDGLIDIAIACHTKQGNHKGVYSRVYYNDGNRFISPRVQLLPTIGPHNVLNADMGNQYDRSYRQTYASSVYKWDDARKKGSLKYDAAIPGKSSLQFAVRSAATENALSKASWSNIKQDFSLAEADRYMQYKAVFTSDNGDRYPALDKVEVTF